MEKVRLPIIWEFTYEFDKPYKYNNNYFYAFDYFNNMDKTKVLEGDIICRYVGQDHWAGIGIIGKNKKIYSLKIIRNNLIVLPAWPIELGIKNGHSLEQLIEIYRLAYINYFIYPRLMQGNNLIIKNGIIKYAYAYSTYDKEDIILKLEGTDKQHLYEKDVFLRTEQEILDFIKYRLGYLIRKRRKVWYSPDYVWKSTGLSMINKMRALEAEAK